MPRSPEDKNEGDTRRTKLYSEGLIQPNTDVVFAVGRKFGQSFQMALKVLHNDHRSVLIA